MKNLKQLIDSYNNKDIILYSELKPYKSLLSAYIRANSCNRFCEVFFVPTDTYGFGGLVCSSDYITEDIKEYVDSLFLDYDTYNSTIETMQFNIVPFKNL